MVGYCTGGWGYSCPAPATFVRLCFRTGDLTPVLAAGRPHPCSMAGIEITITSPNANSTIDRSDRPSATCVLVSFSQFFFHLPFPFLLSRVPHFLPFPPPDLQRRRREAARALPTAHSAANVQRLPPTPNLFLSFPIHLFLLHCLPSPRFSWRRQELSRSAPIVRCCSPRRRLGLDLDTLQCWKRRRSWGWRGSHRSEGGCDKLRPREGDATRAGRFLRAVVGARRCRRRILR